MARGTVALWQSGNFIVVLWKMRRFWRSGIRSQLVVPYFGVCGHAAALSAALVLSSLLT